jgi:ketosteroid isomerase-like protein
MPTRRKSFFRPIVTAGIVLTAAASALFTSQSSASHNSDSVEVRNKAVILSSFGKWSAGTGGPFDLLAEDARWTIEGNSVVSKTYPSREAFMSEVIRPFNARMSSPLKPVIRSLYADGDTVVVFFDARAIARDGKPYSNTYAWFLDMRAGKIVRASAFFDALEFNDLWSRVATAS